MNDSQEPSTTISSNPTSSATSGAPGESQLLVTNQCQEAVDNFRKGTYSRAETVQRISTLIKDADGVLDKDAASRALESYIDMVLEISRSIGPQGRPSPRARERSPSRARGRSRGRSRASREEPRHSSLSGRRQSSTRSARREESSRQTKRHRRRRRRHRGRSPSSSESETDNSSSDAPRKKPRANPSRYGWAAEAKAVKSTMRLEVQLTAKLLREYRIDVAAAKANLLDSTIAPAMPESEWSNLLLGKPVDFDVLLTGRYSSKPNDKHVESVGDVELSYGSLDPVKKVSTFGQWIIAFEIFEAALVFAFPHRVKEVAAYRRHIYGQFETHDPIFATRIVEYDRAVRKSVSENRALLLSDIFEFSPLKDQYIGPTGANVVASSSAEASASTGAGGKGSGAGRVKPARKAEACIRYNNNRCPNLASTCRFKHVCAACSAKGHVESDCSKPKREA